MVDSEAIPNFREPTTRKGEIAYKYVLEAFKNGVTDHAALRLIYKREWMRVLGAEERALRPVKVKKPESMVADKAREEAKASGITDKSKLHRIWDIAWKEAKRRTRGAKKLNLNSQSARAGRRAVEELRAAGVTNEKTINNARTNAARNALPPSQKSELNKKSRDAYHKDNEKQRLRARERRKKHPTYLRDYKRNRRKNDPTFDLRERLRHIIYLRLGASGKRPRTDTVVNCDSKFFQKWMESHFRDGMTWENRGKWHIEHVFPVSACATHEDLVKSCFYRNLKPEWGSANSQKTCKITEASLISAYFCGISQIVLNYDWQMPRRLIKKALALGFSIERKYAG